MAQFRKDTHQFLNDGKTIFETVMLADQYGNIVGAANPSGMAVDAFGRARVSQPLTLFDSFHRYQDNGKINTANTATGTFTHDSNSSIVSLTVDTTSGAYVKRESSKVFAYQPGKSLQILQTYILNPSKENLRQRFGYFGEENGVFLQLEDNELSFIIRSSSTGSLVENKVVQSNWNIDKLDGTGPSKLTLDITKAQIQFIDIEWLGLGTVRVGFVINGQFIHCHSFHHANLITNTYMTTGCLPVRAEIENIGITESSSTLQILCTTVISEGGYELKGRSRGIIMPFATPKDIPTAGTFVPLISIRLKDTRSDAIVVPKNIEFFGITNNTKYIYKIITGATLANTSWVSAGADSSVEYDVSATTITGGIDRQLGYVNISAGAGGSSVQLDANQLFNFQLERNSFAANNKGFAFTLAATGATNGDDAIGGITWEEIT
jgi:hypothetical protein